MAKEEKAVFSKEQLLNSKRYANSRDCLKAKLKDDKFYSFEQVDAMINGFLKRKVK